MNYFKKFIGNRGARAGSLYLIGNIFNKAIAFLTIPIFTRLLTTSDYGIVNTYLSWVAIFSVVVGLSLGNSIRNAYTDFKEDLDGYISSIFSLSLLNFAISLTLILCIAYNFRGKIDLLLVFLCLVESFMEFIIDSISIRYMMDTDYLKKTLLMAMPNIIIAILSIIFILNMTRNKYYGRIIPYVLVTSVIGIFYLVITFIKGKKFINKKYWKYALGLSLPLIFHGLSLNILSNFDRTMITALRNSSETGIYSMVYNLGMVVSAVTASMESVWIPWFTRKLQIGDKSSVNKEVKLYVEIVVVLIFVILMLSPEVLVIMAPKEYWGGKILIPPIILASFIIFLYTIAVDIEYYYKSTKSIAMNTLIAASTNIILNYFLIPKYGALAASFTTVFSYLVSLGIHYYNARKLDNELVPLKFYLEPLAIVIGFVILTYLLLDYSLIRWIIAIIGFIIYVIISLKKNRFSFLN